MAKIEWKEFCWKNQQFFYKMCNKFQNKLESAVKKKTILKNIASCTPGRELEMENNLGNAPVGVRRKNCNRLHNVIGLS